MILSYNFSTVYNKQEGLHL